MKEIYYNGVIYTGTGQDAEVLVVEDGVVADVLSQKEMEMKYGKPMETDSGQKDGRSADYQERKISFHNLQGHFLVPGFNDSHMHILNYGYALRMADLSEHTGSMREMLQYLKEWIKENQPSQGSWIVGRGWNHDYFQDEKRFPDRRDLDTVSAEYPILMVRACGHIACANTKALERAGITADTPQPEGGRIDLGEDGRPDGIFREYGVDLIKAAVPKPSLEEIKDMLLLAMKHLNRYGVTSAQSDDLAAFPGVDYETVLTAYRELEAEGRMTVKVYEQSLLSNRELLRDFLGKGWKTGSGSDFFRIGPLKLLSDGSLGARTAYLSEPYSDGERGQKGIAIYSQEELDGLVGLADREGMQIAIHAIGDGAMEMAVSAIEKAVKENPDRPDRRHGIVHCQITTKKLLEDFKRLKLHAYVQTIFLDYDSQIVEARVGEERAKDTYQFKTLYAMGVPVSNGSDCPVEKPDVMAGIQCAVTRTSLDGTKTFLPGEALTVEEALQTYTSMGARASFEEMKKGRLMVGMAADFTILDRDIRVIPANEIKNTVILSTCVNGRCVYMR